MGEQIFGTPNWGRINCGTDDEIDQLQSCLEMASGRADKAERRGRELEAQLTAAQQRIAELEAQLAAVPLDDIQRMQGCEAHTKINEWAKIRVANWLRQQGRYGYPLTRADINVDGEICPCCGDSDVYRDATNTWRQCGDCEYVWRPPLTHP
jgi:ribosomal protein S27AE